MEETLAQVNAKVYTDIQGLQQLRYSKDTSAVKKEVAQQFESILMQMVLSSMREANKAFSGDLFGSNQMTMYQDIFDKQLSLLLSNENSGFASMVEKSLNQMEQVDTQQPTKLFSGPVAAPASIASPESKEIPSDAEIKTMVQTINQSINQDNEKFSTPEDFVKHLWKYAKIAASAIGADPAILIAQAALETNWGKKIIAKINNSSTHNLFNIKSDSNWKNEIASVETLEEKNGVLSKEKASFRSYESYNESFSDYVNILKQNQRYSDSLNYAHNPEKFVNSLQKAGFATDHQYGEKVMKIFNSHTFRDLISKAGEKI